MEDYPGKWVLEMKQKLTKLNGTRNQEHSGSIIGSMCYRSSIFEFAFSKDFR